MNTTGSGVAAPDCDAETYGDSHPTLLFTSHAHAPPLQPVPDIEYDLRPIPNPPKSIRDHYKGLSRRVREHMLTETGFAALLERAESDIKTAMANKIAQQAHGPDAAGEVTDAPAEETAGDVRDGAFAGPSDPASEPAGGPVLRIGAFCQRGHHRSVAFLEELSRKTWPKDWEIRVSHRDLYKNRKDGKQQGDHRRSGAAIDSAEWDADQP